MRNHLSAPALYEEIQSSFEDIQDPRQSRLSNIPLVDTLMSAAAMFFFKSASLLAFEKSTKIDPMVEKNIKSIFRIGTVPSDTAMREIIDRIPTENFRSAFKKIFAALQRGKILERFIFLGKYYLLSLDGTGIFSSGNISCQNCCIKEHKDGSKTYYHQALAGVLVHPDLKNVIAFPPEPISGRDGSNKNDCERNSAKRFLTQFRTEHPHLEIIVTEDGLASNEPHIKLLMELEMKFILGCKPGDHKYLFDLIEIHEKNRLAKHYEQKIGKVDLKFRYVNNVPLNASAETKVNFLEVWETKADGSVVHFSWVTDFEIDNKNVYEIMRGGRARWRIENETFNTLKNQGYELEHNYGHGSEYLSNNLMTLMMLVFFIDQVLLMSCKTYQEAKSRHKRTFKELWEAFRAAIKMLEIENMESLINILAFGVRTTYTINTRKTRNTS